MRDIDDYVRCFLREALQSGDLWTLVGEQLYSDEFDRVKFESTLQALGLAGSDIVPDGNLQRLQQENPRPLSTALQLLAPALIQDMDDWTRGKYREILAQVRIVLAPLRYFSAFCVNRDENRQRLSGNLIMINQALYFCARLLATASLLESMQGQLEQYKANGAESYQAATRLFLRPNTEDINHSFFEGLPPEVLGQAEAIQSQATMIVLCFVALHELGHIVHNDHELLDVYRLQATNLFKSDDSLQDSAIDTQPFWDAEYRADAFAIQVLCDKAKSPLEAWANFSQIQVFFGWLDDCERRLPQIFTRDHPPPTKRVERLKKIMTQNVGLPDEVSEYLHQLEKLRLKWNIWEQS